MNLTELFNFKFLKENLKKSKGALIFIFTLIPIFTFLMVFSSANQSVFTQKQELVATLIDISLPSAFGMYILPVALSILLFSFIFKRKSVDFVNSMPIKRKTIFATNTIAGIALFAILLLITMFLIGIVDAIFKEYIIPSSMYFYFFINWFTTFVFVFTVSNFAATLSGNIITQIVVIMLLLFLPGFINDFNLSTTHEQRIYETANYDSYGNEISTNEELKIGNRLMKEKSYTTPYKFVRFIPMYLFGLDSGYSQDITNVYKLESVVKMTVLSIIYFGVGLYTFSKRKMEICETTFKSDNTHNFVRCLTLIPFLIYVYLIIENSGINISTFIIFGIILTYYFAYDLITKKSLTNIKRSLVSLIIIMFFVGAYFLSVKGYASSINNNIIEKDDIKDVSLVSREVLSYTGHEQSELLNYYTNDQEIIKLIYKNAVAITKNYEIERVYCLVSFKLNNSSKNMYNMHILKSDYDIIMNKLIKDDKYIEIARNFPYNSIESIETYGKYVSRKDIKKVSQIIESNIEKLNIKDLSKVTKRPVNNQKYINIQGFYKGKSFSMYLNKDLFEETLQYIKYEYK